MLELLILAFWGHDSQNFMQQSTPVLRPQTAALSTTKLPQKKLNKLAPKLINDERLAVFALDTNSGKQLFTKELNRSQHIASLTKIMTFLVIEENHKLDEVVSIPLEATHAIGAQIELYEYEQLTIKTLLEASLIPSANDAALALAIWDAGSEKAFVKKMNQKALELELHSAQFFNSTGLDIEESSGVSYGNKMSAGDLMLLTRIALKNDFFRETVAKDHFYGTSIDEKFFHEKPSTNKLLESFIHSKGVKTGYTLLAGQCFINLSILPDGREIITIVLGSSDRFTETENLVDWILNSFLWK